MTTIADKTAATLVELYDDAIAAYDRAAADDRAEQARGMSGGGTLASGFFNSVNAEIANSAIYDARDKALQAIDAAIEQARAALVEAPDDKTVRFIQSIAHRDDMSVDELTAGFERYDNHLAQMALRAAARRSNVDPFTISRSLGETDAQQDLDRLHSLRKIVERKLAPADIAASSQTQREITRAQIGGTDALAQLFSR